MKNKFKTAKQKTIAMTDVDEYIRNAQRRTEEMIAKSKTEPELVVSRFAAVFFPNAVKWLQSSLTVINEDDSTILLEAASKAIKLFAAEKQEHCFLEAAERVNALPDIVDRTHVSQGVYEIDRLFSSSPTVAEVAALAILLEQTSKVFAPRVINAFVSMGQLSCLPTSIIPYHTEETNRKDSFLEGVSRYEYNLRDVMGKTTETVLQLVHKIWE